MRAHTHSLTHARARIQYPHTLVENRKKERYSETKYPVEEWRQRGVN